MGSDARVVDAARVSFNKLSKNYSEEQNEKLIKYLAKHNHWSPFAHCVITLKEKVPIFVARQRFKHRIGFDYNEVSRRYVDDAPEFFVPLLWRVRPENMKQGSVEGELNDPYTQDDIHGLLDEVYTISMRAYNEMLKAGVAPEQARMVLPQSMYTEYYTTGSLAAWARAYKLRIDNHSQKEIQDLAVEWNKIIRSLFPISWSALVD